jgi:hypothetical protein
MATTSIWELISVFPEHLFRKPNEVFSGIKNGINDTNIKKVFAQFQIQPVAESLIYQAKESKLHLYCLLQSFAEKNRKNMKMLNFY